MPVMFVAATYTAAALYFITLAVVFIICWVAERRK